MVNSTDLNNNFVATQSRNEEIDIKLFFNFLGRNKKLLSLITIVSLFSGYLLSFFPKRTWEGQFQIVLTSEANNNKNFSDLASSFAVFTGGNTNTLKTEVGILKSPSVLMPAFEIVVSKNENLSKTNYEFSQWKNKNLSIELEKGTSILNISYRDQEKDIILPVLQKMSSTYQKYSGIRKQKKNEINQDYLEEQIQIFNRKSSISLKKAQDYAIDKDLIYFDINPINQNTVNRFSSKSTLPGSLEFSNNSTTTFLPLNDSIERARVEASNEINQIDMKLKKINKLNKEESLQYVGSTIPELVKSNFLNILRKIDADIVQAKSKYTDEDISVKRLLEKRILINQQLKERSINYLKSKRLDAEAKLEASLRPKDVLLKYKELIRDAKRDELTLIKLEDQLRSLVLNKSKKEEPWELITKPSLLKNPVDRTRSSILMISLLGGFLLGSTFLFYKEKKSGIIFELMDLIHIIPNGFVEELSIKEIKSSEYKTIYLKEFISSASKNKINLIVVGKIEQKNIQIIKSFLTNNQKNKTDIKFVNSITNIKKENNLNDNFLLIEFGAVTFEEMQTFNKYKQLFDIKITGSLILK